MLTEYLNGDYSNFAQKFLSFRKQVQQSLKTYLTYDYTINRTFYLLLRFLLQFSCLLMMNRFIFLLIRHNVDLTWSNILKLLTQISLEKSEASMLLIIFNENVSTNAASIAN